MITLGSFLNADRPEYEAIASPIFYDENTNDRWIVMTQAEDYIKFTLAQNKPSPYPSSYEGIYGYRKESETEVQIDDVRRMLLDHEQGFVRLGDPTFVIFRPAKEGSGARFAGSIGSSGKLIRISLSESEWERMLYIARAMVNDYDATIAGHVYETRPRHFWDTLVEQLDSWEADKITEQYKYRGIKPDDPVTIEFWDSYDRDRVMEREEALA